MDYKVYNLDCVRGMQQYVESNSIDLVFTDPPYGIEGITLDKHYARDEGCTIPGYIDVPLEEYATFSLNWIKEIERCLKPGGSSYIVSGYTCLREILNALAMTNLQMINHLIAHYTFGVSTKKKWVSSHYHILYYTKPGEKRIFNTDCRFTDIGDSYLDRLSVQPLQRDYKKQVKKNKNQLPLAFVEKFIQYSSNRGDVVLDPFLGGFTTAFASLKLGRQIIGFELNKNAFDYFAPQLEISERLIQDPQPISPSPEVMIQRQKKRAGYKRQKARFAAKTECLLPPLPLCE